MTVCDLILSMLKQNLFVWNCRGARSDRFHRTFKQYMRDYQLEVVAVLEQRISGDSANGVIRKLNFNFSFRVEVDGFKGGIWLLWKRNGAVEVLDCNPQYIHLKYWVNTQTFCFLTVVYACPRISIRKRLWSLLHEIKMSVGNVPWAIAGDFNVKLTTQDR